MKLSFIACSDKLPVGSPWQYSRLRLERPKMRPVTPQLVCFSCHTRIHALESESPRMALLVWFLFACEDIRSVPCHSRLHLHPRAHLHQGQRSARADKEALKPSPRIFLFS